MRSLLFELRSGFFLAAVLWIVGCVFGAWAGQEFSSASSSGPFENASLGEGYSTAAILKVNFSVLFLAGMGVFTSGITTLLTLFWSGVVFGEVASVAYQEGLGLRDLFLASAPHSIELPALWLAASIGLLGPSCMSRFVRGGGFLPDHSWKTLTMTFGFSVVLTAIAAVIEVEVTIGMIAG